MRAFVPFLLIASVPAIHRGFFPGSLSEMRHYPAAKVAVAVLVNASDDRRLSRALPAWATAFATLAVGK